MYKNLWSFSYEALNTSLYPCEVMHRTHTNGEIRSTDVKKKVTLCGWVQSRRDHGGVIFIDLRDRYGLTQVVFDPAHNKESHGAAEHLGREWVLKITGVVRSRKEGMINPKLATGEVEVIVDHLEILSVAATPPLEIEDRVLASEEMRLQYRYLDLRRPQMQHYLMMRHRAMKSAMDYFTDLHFVHVETPMLVKSTPEGARDYIVPSRVNTGQFYALPQSPQLYKQILMVAGMDRYFQFARCLRDEDLRADRQPEHTQIDVEMSFVELEDLYATFEGLFKKLWKDCLGVTLPTPFPRLTYHDAMNRYGSDKPDLRFDLELCDVTSIMKQSDFTVFRSAVESGGVVKCLRVPGAGEKFSRSEIDSLIELAKVHHAKGLAWMKMADVLESNIVKFFSPELQKKIVSVSKVHKGDLLLFVADEWPVACNVLGQIRLHLGEKLGMISPGEHRFCFITDFPLFEFNKDDGRIEPMHHMFCMPKVEHLSLLEKEPLKVLCTQYDLVLNGSELGSGSLRIHRSDIQERVMKVIGLSQEELDMKFGFLLEAFRYGAPPHGGIGLGFDRIVGHICGLRDIREVIAFPKNKSAQCPMDGSPSAVEDKQLRELHLKLDIVKKK